MTNAKPRLLSRLLAAGGLAAALAAAPAVAKENVLTVGNPFAPLSLDPALSGNGRAGTWLFPTYEPLVRTLADGSLEPALATSWEMSDDLKVLTVTLREGVTFSNGEAVNAAAVKKSIDYFVGRSGPFAANLAKLTGVEVVSDHVLTMTFSEPTPVAMKLFDHNWNAGWIICPAGVDNPETLLTKSCGAGPYVLDADASVSGKSYTYLPNPSYYNAEARHWDRIKVSVFLDQNSGVQALRANQLNVLISDPMTAHMNRSILGDRIRLIHSPVQWAGLVLMDRAGDINPALGDVRVRRALNMGIDRNLVAQAMFGDLAYGTAQLQVKGFDGYQEGNEAVNPFDVDAAKALLAEAGFADGLTVKAGYVSNTLNNALFQAYADQLSQIGVTLEPEIYQGIGASLQARKERKIETLLFNTNSGVPNLAMVQTLSPNGSLNPYASSDPELSALIAAASRLTGEEARQAWDAVYAKVVELAWFLPVIGIDAAYLATSNVEVPEIGQSIVIDITKIRPRS